ncbi:hypothetical protein QBC41DRAFT_390535 [Cercophora samala]|uniref:Peptidase metallopeptidase domain-containing protein n=1 Tax=Cercophora samala TaxID=330535 RepID=A0AA39ZGA1_9PEZI|nr:hypothetical protein QBC41DRAFT_390535 [Cercophora samala]
MPSYELGMETFVASQKEASEVSLAPSPMPDNLDILPSGSIVIGPSPEQQDLLDRALKASVGSIIFAMTPCVDAPCASMPPDLEDLDEDPESESYSELVVAKSWTWEPGHTIRIRFLDGSPEWQEKVETYARQWIAGANLKMDFVDETDTDPVDIRISFNRRKPTRSCIGTRSREVPQDKATMNFQFPAAEDFEGTVLHEFGHALGALHEHQSPAGGISWNKSFVYGYYGITNGWSQDRIDREIFYRYTDKKIREMKVQNSIFDAQSVMMYNITRGMTNDGFSVKRCQKLSPLDKHFIAVAYGPDKKPETDNVNALDENYGFPLYWAAAGGHLSEVTDLLTKRGADPNFRSLFDWTALHWAARNGHIAIVALLLFHGAKVDVLSDTRKTPLDLARVNGDRSIIEMLEMANRNQELAVVAA